MPHVSQDRSTTEEQAVHARYGAAAQAVESALCCPVSYDPRYLEVIPQEVLDRDYGCGDPTSYVREGETVLDLGAGGGKVCFIASQIVGPNGNVIGVDCNPEMLDLARRHQPVVAERLGFDNVDFRCGLIQDLQLDLERLQTELSRQPVGSYTEWLTLRAVENSLREKHPLIATDSVDCVVSNCVLNLVRPQDREQLFREVFRVLKRGGRAAISDIVADETVPERLRQDPELWSGCISGAFREDEFLRAFEQAGFHGIQLASRQIEPWRTVDGIEFRSVTVMAYKGKQGPCWERNQALVYKGPFRQVEDDDGHRYRRGERVAVCDKIFHLLRREPYAGMFEPIPPRVEVPLEEAQPFDCRRARAREARETKGLNYLVTTETGDTCCGPKDGECC